MKFRSPMKALLVMALGLVFSLLNTGTQGLARSDWCSPTLDEPCILASEHSCPVWSVVFSPDGRLLAAGSLCGVTVWEVATGAKLWFAPQPRPSGSDNFSVDYCSLTFNPDGTLLAGRFYGWPGTAVIALWDVETAAEVWSLDENCDYTIPAKIVFSADGRVLARGSAIDGHEVILHEVATGNEVDRISEYGEFFAGLAFSLDGRLLAGASVYGRIVFWDVQHLVWWEEGDNTYVSEMGSLEEWVVWPPWVLAFQPSNLPPQLFAYSGGDGTIKFVSEESNAPKPLEVERGSLIDIAFSADGGVLASVSEDDPVVLLWNVANGELLWEIWPSTSSYLYIGPDFIKSLSFSPDGLLAVGYEDSTVELWDVSAVIGEAQEPIEVPDENLARVIRTQLGKSPEEPINLLDMLALTSLDAASQGIIDLYGIHHAANLQQIKLRDNELSDITYLQHLTGLAQVDLADNEITGVSWGLCENWGLGKGDYVDITGNLLDVSPGSQDMDDIQSLIDRGVEVQFDLPSLTPAHVPDENLARVIRNTLGKRPEETINEADLQKLTELVAIAEGIADLTGLEYAVNLTNLDLYGNEISDISVLLELPSLVKVDLEENPLDLSPGSKTMEVIQVLLDRGVAVEY